MNSQLSLKAAVLIAMASAATGSANAQTSSITPVEAKDTQSIIVVGQRRLSRDPLEAKIQSISVQDSIGAVEIERLTDTTVANVLTRLPGLSMQRAFQSGKAWYATIRGFDGNYNSVDLDGGMFIDSTRNDRANYLDVVPAAAINELVVTKTVTPDLDPNSIGGHISIRTLRSFDLGSRPLYQLDFAVADYEQNGARKSYAPGLSGGLLAKNTFGPGGDYGFVFALSAQNDRRSEIFNNATTYNFVGDASIPSGPLQHGNFDLHDHGASFLGKLDMRRGDRFYGFAALNLFKNDMEQDNYRGSLAITPASISNAVKGSGSFATASAQGFSRRYIISRDVKLFTTGFDYQAAARSKLSAVVSYGHSDHNETLWNSAPFLLSGLSGTYALSEQESRFTLAPNASLSDAANWRINPTANSGITYLPMTDKVATARLDYAYNAFAESQGFGFATGATWRRLDRKFVQSADNYTLPTGTVLGLNQVLAAGAPTALDGSGIVYIDFDKFWSNIKSTGINRPTTTPSSSYELVEDAIGGYAFGQFAKDKFRGLAGFRYEYTAFDDTTAKLQGSTPVPFSFSRNYASLLPNVQAFYDVSSMLRLRAAYTETIARPIPTSFAQGLTINNFSSATPFVRGSNPDLKARKSSNIDIAADFTFEGGYASIAGFTKDISNEIYFVSRNVTDSVAGTVSQVVTPQNAGSSTLKGVEASFTWSDFTSLSPALEGLSITTNYTWLDGELVVVNQDMTSRKLGGLGQQPKYLFNVVTAYERGPFAASIVYGARGRALNGVGATSAADTYIDPFTTLNARLAYQVTKTLEIFAVGENLTKSWWFEKTGPAKDQHLTAIQDGRTIRIGAKARF
jgi:TonB-dependent receptor